MGRERNTEERIEPVLEPASDEIDEFGLRVTDADRAAPSRSKKPRKATSRGSSKGRGRSARGRTKPRRTFGSRLRRVAYWGMIASIWGLVALGGIVAYFGAELPRITSWTVPDRPPNVRIVSVDGELIANRGDTGGEAVRLADLPDYLPQAIVAAEDRRFYSHFGLDPIGMARALVAVARAGSAVQGASTITQQLARHLFLTQEKTVERKIQEAILAVWLEARYSKDDILEMYLNRVYFGAGAYGVDAAARRYFGKPASSVTLTEAAMLAGLLPAPSRYAPTVNREVAEGRAQLVISSMLREGYITEREASLAMSVEVTPRREMAGGSGRYVADWVMDLLPDFIGRYDRDIVVDTTIDLALQSEAARAVENGLLEHGAEYDVTQASLVAMDPNGAVRALIGGRDYSESQYNRAVTAMRQPGSAFKPFVYLAALEAGLTPETVRIDAPVTIGNWSPENYTDQYRGPVTLMTALSNSLNTVAAQLAAEVGPDRVVEVAHRLGIASDLAPNPSIALGTSEVNLLELTGAFAPFANGGNGIIPHVIRQIRTVDGNVLYDRRGTGSGQVVYPEQLGMMNYMLRQTLESGTAQRATIEGWQAGGKTGTSQNWRDAWFVGYTAHLVAGIWFGNDDGSPTERATGGALSASVWHDFMAKAHEGVTPEELPGNYRYQDPNAFSPYAAPPQTVQGYPPGQYPPGYPPGYQGQPAYPPGEVPQGYPPAAYPGYPTANGQPVPPMVVGAGGPAPGAYPPPPEPRRPGFFRRLFGLD